MESCTKFYCIHNSVFNNKFAPLYPPRFRLHFEEMVPKKLSNSLKICFTKKCAKQKFAYIKSSIKVICMFFLRCSLSMLELWKDTQYEIHSCIELNYPSQYMGCIGRGFSLSYTLNLQKLFIKTLDLQKKKIVLRPTIEGN